jgi:hypothetical protein
MPPSRVGGSQRLCHRAARPIVLVCTELPSLRVQSPRTTPARRCVHISPTMGLSSDSSASFMSSIAD